jgi:hypothetical protein
MCDSLPSLLGPLDIRPAPVFSRQQIDWPESEFQAYLTAGLLRPAESPRTALCPDCGETADVHYPPVAAPEPRAHLSCSQCGPQSVRLAEIACWQMDLGVLLDRLANAVGATGSREETVRGRIWRLGKARIASAARSVYFARQLARTDAASVIAEARFSAASLVFVPRQVPPTYLQIATLPPIARLVDVAMWADGHLALDLSALEGLFPATAISDEQSTKRGTRLAIIEALRHELSEHLRAARDHAFATRGATGTATLLPRPSQDLLARQLGVHRSTISRSLEDPSARELQLLWEVAGDLDRILALGTSHGPDVQQGPFDARAQGEF